MFCSKCGNKSPAGALFCHKCGTKIANTLIADNQVPIAPLQVAPTQQYTSPAMHSAVPMASTVHGQAWNIDPIQPHVQNPAFPNHHIPNVATMPHGFMPVHPQNLDTAMPSAVPNQSSDLNYTPTPIPDFDYTALPDYPVSPPEPESSETKQEASYADFSDYQFFPKQPNQQKSDTTSTKKEHISSSDYTFFPTTPKANKLPEPQKPKSATQPVLPNPQPSASQPPMPTPQPQPSASQPFVTTPQPQPSASQPFVSTAQPQPSASQPFVSTAQPQPSASQPFVSTAQPQPSASQPFISTPQPQPSASQPFISAPQPQPSTSQPVSTPQPDTQPPDVPQPMWQPVAPDLSSLPHHLQPDPPQQPESWPQLTDNFTTAGYTSQLQQEVSKPTEQWPRFPDRLAFSESPLKHTENWTPFPDAQTSFDSLPKPLEDWSPSYNSPSFTEQPSSTTDWPPPIKNSDFSDVAAQPRLHGRAAAEGSNQPRLHGRATAEGGDQPSAFETTEIELPFSSDTTKFTATFADITGSSTNPTPVKPITPILSNDIFTDILDSIDSSNHVGKVPLPWFADNSDSSERADKSKSKLRQPEPLQSKLRQPELLQNSEHATPTFATELPPVLSNYPEPMAASNSPETTLEDDRRPKKKSKAAPVLVFFILLVAIGLGAMYWLTGWNVLDLLRDPSERVVGTWEEFVPVGQWRQRYYFNENGTGRSFEFNLAHDASRDEIYFYWTADRRNRLSISNDDGVLSVLELAFATREGRTTLRLRSEDNSQWREYWPIE